MRMISPEDSALVSGAADLKCSGYTGSDTKIGCEGNLSDVLKIAAVTMDYLATVPFTAFWVARKIDKVANK